MDTEARRDYWRRCLVDATSPNYHLAVERLNEAYAVQDQDVRDARVRHILGHLSQRLFSAGVDAGISELLAQGIESGLDLNVSKDDPLFSDDGPLSDDWEWDD